MKILTERNGTFDPFGQMLFFSDGSGEFDPDCAQTTAILTAEQYNGKAAKDDNGQWIAAPGPRNHDMEFDIVGFHVGLTYIQHDGEGKALFDYSVITPTGVAFHGNEKDGLLAVPPHWHNERVAAEIISWICIGEDSGTDFSGNTTPQQWEWIRSIGREYSSMETDEWLEDYDRR